MLILFLSVASKAISQTDTTRKASNDSVTISQADAQRIVKELMLSDVLKQENTVLKTDTLLLRKQSRLKDTLLTVSETKYSLLNTQLNTYKLIENNYKQLQKNSTKQVKWLRFQRTGMGVLLIGSLVFFAINR